MDYRILLIDAPDYIGDMLEKQFHVASSDRNSFNHTMKKFDPHIIVAPHDTVPLLQDNIPIIILPNDPQVLLDIINQSARFQELADCMPHLIWTAEPDGNVDYYNNKYKEFDGIQKKGDLFIWAPVVHPDDKDRTMQAWEHALKTGDIYEVEHRIKTKQGYRWFLSRGIPIKDSENNVKKWYGAATDIHEQKNIHDQLRESEERLRNVLESTTDGVISLDEDWCFTYINQQGSKILKMQTSDLMGKCIWEVFPHGKKSGFGKAYRKAIQTGRPVEFEEYYPEPLNSWFEVHAYPMEKGISLYFRDITDQKKAFQALKKSEEMFMSYADAMPQMAFIADASGEIFYYNKRHYQYFGLNPDHDYSWEDQNLQHPQDLRRTIKNWRNSIETGEPYEVEYRLRRFDGVYRWHIGRALPLKDDSGHIKYWFGTNTDIHEQKKSLKQKDEFMSVVSHELKTPLTSLKAYAQLLQKEFEDRQDIRAAKSLEKMNAQVDKLNNLVSDLLDASRLEGKSMQYQKGTFDINALAREIVDELQQSTDMYIFLDMDENCVIHGDRRRIGQVMSNFITNAIKYSPQEDSIKVGTSVQDDKVTFYVEDKGIGISREDQKNIFQRFYRAGGPQFPGLGLGLYISAEIIRSHRGKIWVESQKDKGSTFSFSLPIKHVKD